MPKRVSKVGRALLALCYLVASLLSLGHGGGVAWAADGAGGAWIVICADEGLRLQRVEGPDAEVLLAAGLAVAEHPDAPTHPTPMGSHCPLCLLASFFAVQPPGTTSSLLPPFAQVRVAAWPSLEVQTSQSSLFLRPAVRGPPSLL